MKKIIVAVGSKRLPKLNAVWEALNVVGPTLDPDAQFEVVGEEVASGVGHTPLSRAETMAGAQRRVDALLARAWEGKLPWSYFVGLEGGLDLMAAPAAARQPLPGQRLVFLQNWACVSDGRRTAFGQSGSVLLPEPLAVQVVDQGIELAQAIDAFAGGRGIRDAQGAWGVFTRNMITRQDAFRTAVVNAFAPFFNSTLYR